MHEEVDIMIDMNIYTEDGNLTPKFVERVKTEKHVRCAVRGELWGIDFVLEDDGTISELNDIGGGVSRFDASGTYTCHEHQETTYRGKGMVVCYGSGA